MNFSPNVSSGMAAVLAVLTTIVTVVTTVFWMIVGWRAMRADVRLADNIEQRPN